MENLTFNDLPLMVGRLCKQVDKLEKFLREKYSVDNPEQSDQLMTVDQAAEFLNLAKPTVYSMVSRGELPHFKRSKRLYFSREDLMAYIRDGRKMTNEEIKDDAGRFITMRGKEVRRA